MKIYLRTAAGLMAFLLAVSGLLTVTGCASGPKPAPLARHSFSIESLPADDVPAAKVLPQRTADGSLELSLGDCLDIARQNNHDIRLTREALIQADEQVTQARAAMLPYVGLEGSYSRLDEELKSSFGPLTVISMENEIYQAGVVVKQPLFMGGRLNAARQASIYAREARDQRNLALEQEITYQTTRAYRTAQVAEAYKKVAAEAVDLLRAHEHDVALLVKHGATPEIDLLRTRTELANADKELNGAENSVSLAYSALKNLLSLPLDTRVTLTDDLTRRSGAASNLATLTGKALEQRPELQAAEAEISAADRAVAAAKGEYLPTLALEGRYEYLQGSSRDIEGDYHWTIGLGAEMPLWNWGQTPAKVREAESRLSQARIQRKKTEDGIRLEVQQAWLELGKAEKNIKAADTALETSREVYRLSRVRYRAGEGTNTDVLDGRTAMSRAEANHTQALYDYNVALAALDRAVGAATAGKSGSEERESSE